MRRWFPKAGDRGPWTRGSGGGYFSTKVGHTASIRSAQPSKRRRIMGRRMARSERATRPRKSLQTKRLEVGKARDQWLSRILSRRALTDLLIYQICGLTLPLSDSPQQRGVSAGRAHFDNQMDTEMPDLLPAPKSDDDKTRSEGSLFTMG